MYGMQQASMFDMQQASTFDMQQTPMFGMQQTSMFGMPDSSQGGFFYSAPIFFADDESYFSAGHYYSAGLHERVYEHSSTHR